MTVPLFPFQIFNRDEPDREKLVFVTVKATDRGRPALEDVCTLRVRIKDKNDNAPVFDRSIYNVPIAQVRRTRRCISIVSNFRSLFHVIMLY